MKKGFKLIAFILALVMFLPILAACKPETGYEDDGKNYTYRTAFITSPGTWNVHTYQTNDDSMFIGYINLPLYEFLFTDDFQDYITSPCMAAEMPVDVTAQVRVDGKWDMPSNATSGYAYKIALNKDAKWDDGTAINADTYVYSMKQLLDPKAKNHRASSYYQGTLALENAKDYFDGVVTDFSQVGLYKSGDYEITIVLEKPASGFYLYYSLSSSFLVKESLYEAGKQYVGDTYSSTYCTSVATTPTNGPYKLTTFQVDKQIVLERNEKWHGYITTNKELKYPQYEPMYTADKMVFECVPEAETRKSMFLKGELATYGLQAADYATYRSSDYLWFTPEDSLFFLVLNGYEDALEATQATQTDVNKTILLQPDFRKALALAFDRDEFCALLSPARYGGFGIIGDTYVWNVETGETYRNTDIAKQVLVDYYGLEYGAGKPYATLDDAHNAITGYNPTLAKELFLSAYAAELAAGKIDANDKIVMTYSASTSTQFIQDTVKYLSDAINKIFEGTALAGRFEMRIEVKGNDWSNAIRSGQTDCVLGGWTGGRMDPFGLMEVYVNPSYQYDANWFDASTHMVAMTLTGYNNGNPITLSLYDWYEVLNGAEVDGYNFGYQMTSDETRLTILANFEREVLIAGNHIPMMQNATGSLLSMRYEWATEKWNSMMNRGGADYMIFLYTDEEWAAFVQQQGGTLKYD